ncbi:Methenyltetrahydrofolate cyclohydrolase [Candidatus Syntrophocurvum alkaliphilum]|uniref:Bifunctional protein FolD n=1 Tax=Candidatus Syntrophocurvum alkaliphilum TaxID=2293317 RepID=A0A6I6DB07_9FIRM|nr:bifunctional 5,10-methylenetetrahydrofolate dehydrogenase/5,10-methenyltetrahydrofolate cyclohydrolase [Candidatus Syntrophocurvum alkaliphilum]QGT99948.1 Methenyltetrahydrofolate cyclohydrolase [Candidatus Syntrophocurvum alkaliphilum]
MIIYGKEIVAKMKQSIKEEAAKKSMKLVVIQVGDDKTSEAYIRGIKKFADEAEVELEILNLPEQSSENELKDVITKLNNDNSVTGIMIQTPLPKQLDINNLIDYVEKDVEGINNINLGKLISKEDGIKPSTPKAVIRMLKEHNVDLQGKKVTIIGRSKILGHPLAVMMTNENATVTLCHSRTKNIEDEIRNADIIVAALGQANFITADMVREDAVIIDAGINFVDGKMCGDVDEAAKNKAAMASAVPGGVGGITVAELFDNLRVLSEQ